MISVLKLSTEKPSYKLYCSFGKNTLVIKTSIDGLSNELDIVSFDDDFIDLLINAKYVEDTLKTLKSEYVKIGISGSNSPLLVSPDKDTNPISIIMPITSKD